MKVLIMDDSKTARAVLKQIIQGLGYEIFEASHGLEGIEVLEKNANVDLVFVDWNMPQMDGYDFVKTVRSNPKLKQTKLIMVTTEAEMGNVIQAMSAGANDYVSKPFSKETILAKLKEMGILTE